MQQEMIWGYLLLCLVLANIPFLSSRLFLVVPLATKNMIVRLLEWSAFAVVALFAGWGLEQYLTGSVAEQEWEFYITVLFLFMIMAFPGLIAMLKRHKAL